MKDFYWKLNMRAFIRKEEAQYESICRENQSSLLNGVMGCWSQDYFHKCPTNKVRLCERSEPQSEPFVGQAQLWHKACNMKIAF